MREFARNHSFLQRFYESKRIYTEEFEQLYDIVKEEAGNKADNSIVLGRTSRTLRKHYQAKAQPPESIYRENVRGALPWQWPPTMPSILAGLTPQQLTAYLAFPGSERRAMTEEFRYNLGREFGEKIHAYHTRSKYQIKDVTWEEAESLKRCIIGALWNGKQPVQPWIPEDQAKVIRERLLNKCPRKVSLK